MKIQKEHAIQTFSKDHAPVAHAALGDTVEFALHDCYAGQIQSEQDVRLSIDKSKINLATGPVFIDGIRAGETLCIDILDIQVHGPGIMATAPGLGPLGARIEQAETRLLPIQGGYVELAAGVSLPLRPMIGVAGVAPAGEPVHTAIPGRHGGNLDTKDICAGNRLHVPVAVDGALAAFGDLHAAMGDGEMSGTGVEVSGDITVRFSRSPFALRNPLVESPDALFFLASGEAVESAAREAMGDAAAYLQARHNLSFPDAYRLLSAACDLRISQIVNRYATVRVRVPKSW